MTGRPLDVLESSLHEPVTVTLKDGTERFGALAGYDQHMNLVLEAADRDLEAADRESQPADAASIEDTTIIRGDNVVSITI